MKNLKAVREDHGFNMREAAKNLGMPYTTYVNYEKGLREPTSETLIQIADYFSVSIDYLLGRNFIGANHQLAIAPPATEVFTEEETDLIHKYRCLDDRGRAAVRNTLDHEYNSLPGNTAHSPAKEA